ncbi:MAG: bifunctional diguanylate cyclase/phosphodiesterase [Epsilonproteobacteria bacterium]|nr:bifunctional diguanylate cyclase/phosphodiesterase [Campylobacterota bacterium]
MTEYLVFDEENNIHGIEGIVRNITEHSVTKKRISSMLYSDTLTGISNRLHLETLMEKLIVDNYKKNNTFSMLFLDLDHFKHINDTLGHDVGDILLQEVAENISNSIRQEDIFARIGGDEFVIIFKDMKEEQLVMTVEKLMKVIHNLRTINEYKLRVTASIGIVMYPQDGKSTVDLMKSADIAMYESKKRGRNTYTFFQNKHSDSLQNELQMMQDMSLSVDNNEFELHYQPKVLVKGNQVIAAEALVRWEHPTLGHISPKEFIPLAENTGLILKLGRWVVKEVCKFISSFNVLSNNQKMNISINISIRQFQQENLYEVLKENIAKYGIDGSQISLEITESIMMENFDEMVEKLNKIKTLGVYISLDDFGTGYSTLSYLSKLSIDELKIDKAFVDEIPINGDSTIVLDTIIAMGKTLNMSVVAEGVEHEYQRQYLEDKGCDIYQGYLFSKPLMEDAYVDAYVVD